MKAKSASSSGKIICNLVIDEIDIRSELTRSGGKYHGYEDLGFGYSDADSVPLAQKAMVFMLVCLNGKWKIPIAYFLVQSLRGELLSQLVNTALEVVDKANIVVRSVTFDGIATNLTCFKILGAKLDFNQDFQPWFYHPCHKTEKVFLIFDPSHALKLVRNTLGDYILVDDMKRAVKFSDICELFNLNQEKELYNAPRLTKRHIKWRENKMRVRLAAQVLSSSVHAALLHAKEKGFQQFQSCEGTAEFCRQFDQIFDILNCRSVFNKKQDYNIPVETSNVPKFESWCKDAIKYICSLSIVENSPKKERENIQHWSKREKRPVLDHRRKTGFLGFLICLHNLVPLFVSLQSHGLKYLLTYKLSQDHLETWFSAVRSKSGCNNNPNAEQFKSIFKRLLVHHELRTTEGANCELDDTKILSISSRNNKKRKTSNHLTDTDYYDDILNKVVIEDMKYDDIGSLDDYQEDVVAYIAGFILRKLQDKKLCALENLKDSSNQSDLIKLKNRGKLTIPSEIVQGLCSIVEKLFRMYENDLLHPDPSKLTYIEGEILEYLEEHGYIDKLGPHIAALIMQLYIKIKIRYACKRLSTVERDIRHSSKKQPIFNHQ